MVATYINQLVWDGIGSSIARLESSLVELTPNGRVLAARALRPGSTLSTQLNVAGE